MGQTRWSATSAVVVVGVAESHQKEVDLTKKKRKEMTRKEKGEPTPHQWAKRTAQTLRLGMAPGDSSNPFCGGRCVDCTHQTRQHVRAPGFRFGLKTALLGLRVTKHNLILNSPEKLDVDN